MRKKIIFIVEDDRDISELMQIIIEPEGYITKTFFSAALVESSIEKHKPSLVILDLNLEGLDGTKLLKKIRNNKKIAETKIVLVSAKNNLSEISSKVKANGYLSKPFNIKDLKNIVRNLA